MNTLKKYISVIAISTAGFFVDVLKKYVGGIAIFSACLAWLYMILAPQTLPPGVGEEYQRKAIISIVIALFSGAYAIIRGKTEFTRCGGYLAILLMLLMLCVICGMVVYFSF